MLHTNRFFREAAPGGGGGGTTTLADKIAGAAGGGFNPDPNLDPNLDPDPNAEQELLKKEAYDTEGKLKEGYTEVDGKIVKQQVPAAEEGVNDDGTLKPGYKKDTEGKVVKDPDYKEDTEVELTEEEEVQQFFEKLDTINGFQLKVDYPEGVDPLTPEGLAVRDAVLINEIRAVIDQTQRNNDPRAYAYSLHRRNGGTDEQFFQASTDFKLPEETELEKSPELQEKIYRQDLLLKGLNSESIELLVKDAITKSKLLDKAKESFTAIDNSQKKLLEDAAEENRKRNEKMSNDISKFISKVDNGIASSKFVIQENDKNGFKKFIEDQLRYDQSTGQFHLNQPVEAEELNHLLDALYFQYKKGNLESLIVKQAKTQTAQSIRARLKPGAVKPGKGSGGGGGNSTGFVSLGSLMSKIAQQQ